MKALKYIDQLLTSALILFGLTGIYATLTPGVPVGGTAVAFALVLLCLIVVEHFEPEGV